MKFLQNPNKIISFGRFQTAQKVRAHAKKKKLEDSKVVPEALRLLCKFCSDLNVTNLHCVIYTFSPRFASTIAFHFLPENKKNFFQFITHLVLINIIQTSFS